MVATQRAMTPGSTRVLPRSFYFSAHHKNCITRAPKYNESTTMGRSHPPSPRGLGLRAKDFVLGERCAGYDQKEGVVCENVNRVYSWRRVAPPPPAPPPPSCAKMSRVYTFQVRVVVRGEDDAQYQSDVPSVAVVKWYRRQLQSPYSDDQFQPCDIRVSKCGDFASDGIRIAFRLQYKTPTVATPDDVLFFKSMMVDPDDDGNYPIRVSAAVPRALIIGALN
jgi:hypothetical protein